MPEPKKPKKSESLEIRIPYPTKQAFMARCRAEGRSASDALRSFIDQHLETPDARGLRPPSLLGGWSGKSVRLIAGVLAATAVGAVALPSLARPNPGAEFARLDTSGDNFISFAEFSRVAAIDIRVSFGPSRSTILPVRDTDLAADARIRVLLLRTEFDHIDTDGDGRISFSEYRRYSQRSF